MAKSSALPEVVQALQHALVGVSAKVRLASQRVAVADRRSNMALLQHMLNGSPFLPVDAAHMRAALRSIDTVTHHVLTRRMHLNKADSARDNIVELIVFESSARNTARSALVQVDHAHLLRVLLRVATVQEECPRLMGLLATPANNKPKQPLRVLFLPLVSKRRFPVAGELVGPRHLNGGFYSARERVIVIMRHEEHPKVLLHEVLHDLLHVAGVQLGVASPGLKTMLHVQPARRVLMEEAVVETWAVVAQVALTAPDVASAVQRAVQGERARCGALVRKLAAAYNWPRQPWNERTNAFAYIFLRCAFMGDLEAFLRVRLGHGDAAVRGLDTQARLGAANTLARLVRLPVHAPTSGSLRMTRYGSL